MKRFRFRLDRVLEFRRQQAEAAEYRLRQIRFEAAQLQGREAQLREAAQRSRRALASRGPVTGTEMRAADSYYLYLEGECGRIRRALVQVDRMRSRQLEEVLEARRRVKLLEILRERRVREHQRELDRLADKEAGELHLAKLIRSRRS